MSTHKYIDRICVIILICTLAVTVLFMNGEALGIQVIVDEDAENHSDSVYFTTNDLDGNWDSSDAVRIILSDSGISVSGNGAYVYDNTVVIANGGTYVVSGSASDAGIIVDAYSSSKVHILFDGVTLSCTDDACFQVLEADKVFLTLADGSVNSLESGSSYSSDAESAGRDGAVFAADDLTINGSGSLTITSGYRHGIEANDDCVITGGSISITAAEDGINVNDSLRICIASITIDAGDDAIMVKNEDSCFYMESGLLDLTAGNDAIHAGGDITIDGGDLSVHAGDDAIHSDSLITVNAGTLLLSECYEGLEAPHIDVTGGDITVYASDDGFNASDGSGSSLFQDMGGGMGGMNDGFGRNTGSENEISESTDVSAAAETEELSAQSITAEESGSSDINESSDSDNAANMSGAPDISEMPDMSGAPDMGEIPDMSGAPDMGEMPDMSGAPNMGEMPDMSEMSGADETTGSSAEEDSLPAENTDEDSGSSEEEDTFCWIHISGGSILIVNENAQDADGLDSNGDIIITGGDVRISLTNSGTNNAIDYASENGGTAEISGGTVVACGSYSMAEGFESGSTQPSILYTVSEGAQAGTTVALEDSDGNVLLSYESPCSFSCVTISCPELTVGKTYTVVIGENEEDITIEETAASYGDAQSSMFGGTFNIGGGMQSRGGSAPNGNEMQMPGFENSSESSEDAGTSSGNADTSGNLPGGMGGHGNAGGGHGNMGGSHGKTAGSFGETNSSSGETDGVSGEMNGSFGETNGSSSEMNGSFGETNGSTGNTDSSSDITSGSQTGTDDSQKTEDASRNGPENIPSFDPSGSQPADGSSEDQAVTGSDSAEGSETEYTASTWIWYGVSAAVLLAVILIVLRIRKKDLPR